MCTHHASRLLLAAMLAAVAVAALGGFAAAVPPAEPADPAIAVIQHGPKEELSVMNADGSNLATIYSTRKDYLSSGPSWSPDGGSIAFVQSFDLWRIDVIVEDGEPTGDNATFLVEGGIFHPAWSPLGDEIAFVDVNERTLYVIPAGGGTPTPLHTSPEGVACRYPAWSPDGNRIAFVEFVEWVEEDPAYGISLLERDEWGEWGEATVLPYRFVGTLYPRFLDWGRLHDVLTFDWQEEGATNRGIYTLDLGTGYLQLVVSNGYFPTWSPDDERILFADARGLKILTLSTGAVTKLPKKATGNWPDWRRF